jgi:hypothetical protein
MAGRDERVQPFDAMDKSFLHQEGEGAIHRGRRRLRMDRAKLLQQCIGPDWALCGKQQAKHGSPQRRQNTAARPALRQDYVDGAIGFAARGQRRWHPRMI